jgi:hypothetical protein
MQAPRDTKISRGQKLPEMMMVFVMMRENFREMPIYVDLAPKLGVEQIIFKNLDVVLRDGHDERRLFSHGGPTPVDVAPEMAAAQKRAEKRGISLGMYAMQPQKLTIFEQDPLHNLFVNWAGHMSPCIWVRWVTRIEVTE